MEMMQKLGGRKFLMALMVIGAAMYLEMYGKGLSPTMASFLIAMVSGFHVANYAATAKYMGNRQSPSGGKVTDSLLHEKLDNLTATVNTAMGSESKDHLVQLLTAVIDNTQGLKATVAQTGQAVVNLAGRIKG